MLLQALNQRRKLKDIGDVKFYFDEIGVLGGKLSGVFNLPSK